MRRKQRGKSKAEVTAASLSLIGTYQSGRDLPIPHDGLERMLRENPKALDGYIESLKRLLERDPSPSDPAKRVK